MRIYTTYFANIKKLPDNIVPISIALKNPINWNGKCLKKLAPPWYILKQYMDDKDEQAYTRQYKKVVLCQNQSHIVQQLAELACTEEKIIKKSDGMEIVKEWIDKDVALVCYEKPDDFCHRHLVADWLNEAGYDVKEWKP